MQRSLRVDGSILLGVFFVLCLSLHIAPYNAAISAHVASNAAIKCGIAKSYRDTHTALQAPIQAIFTGYYVWTPMIEYC